VSSCSAGTILTTVPLRVAVVAGTRAAAAGARGESSAGASAREVQREAGLPTGAGTTATRQPEPAKPAGKRQGGNGSFALATGKAGGGKKSRRKTGKAAALEAAAEARRRRAGRDERAQERAPLAADAARTRASMLNQGSSWRPTARHLSMVTPKRKRRASKEA
jgi:hypothetical protein